MTVAVTRKEPGAVELRREAGRCRDARAARRMLALALVLEGASREEAARAAGMDRPTLRDWVHRYNEEGLPDRRRPGPRSRLTPGQEAELEAVVERGPDPDRDGVVRWRRVDLKALIEARFAVRLHERSVGKVLRRLGFVHDADGFRDPNVASVVATDRERSGDILLELSTNTYQAYNEWGGYSLYVSDFVGTNAQTVSFDRPTAPDFFRWEYHLALWLERYAAERGLKVGYATNFDVHRDPTFVEKYRLFVSGSHNEYWSLEEFEAVHRRIFELGRNTVFMGANTAYWQVRYADVNGAGADACRGRQLVCFKSLDDPVRFRGDKERSFDLITMRFRDGARRPETMMMGVAYQGYFSDAAVPPIRCPYVVARTDLPFFEGTGYRVGDPIGDVVGYEWDNTDPDGDGRRLWDPQRSRIPPLDPTAIKVPFTGAPVDIDGKPGRAEAAYFVSPAGAKVFSSGSIRWALGLGAPGWEQERFKLLNRNLLDHMLA